MVSRYFRLSVISPHTAGIFINVTIEVCVDDTKRTSLTVDDSGSLGPTLQERNADVTAHRAHKRRTSLGSFTQDAAPLRDAISYHISYHIYLLKSI